MSAQRRPLASDLCSKMQRSPKESCLMSVRSLSVPQMTKAVVTVAEMARMIGLSRSRFYQLVQAGIFPHPCYDLRTRRPLFVEEQQATCIEVRRRNCGVNGDPILFYARRPVAAPSAPHRAAPAARPAVPQPTRHAALLEALTALGLASVTSQQVDAAHRSCFPNGTSGIEEGQVIRALFVHLRQGQRQNSGDRSGR